MVCARRRGGEVQIEARDSGIGIPAGQAGCDIRRVLPDRQRRARSQRWLGLGLAIVARMARLLGTAGRGPVGARSRIGVLAADRARRRAAPRREPSIRMRK